MAACSLGMHVILTEEFEWVGGQLTSQAVPPDEHPWIEYFGCTARYRRYRNLVRAAYAPRLKHPLNSQTQWFNPGGGWVSLLCHDPAIGHKVLRHMLADETTGGKLELRPRTRPISAESEEHIVRAVVMESLLTGELERIEAKYILDATELGGLLPMTGTAYVAGAESKQDTGEPHALDGPANPENVQGFTWVMALGFDPGGNHTIEKPSRYDFWKQYQPDFWPDKLLSFKMLHVQKGHPIDFLLFGNDRFNLFEYRQIVDPSLFAEPMEAATIANWPQNDYYEGNIIDKPAEEVAKHLQASRELSVSMLYWLQTEAPRHDGGVGYPEIRLRPDLVGTSDGLAQAPYIRESRRIHARFTVCEQHVSAECNPGLNRAPEFKDSVGVGAYRIDLHPSTSGDNTFDASSLPFQIPLGALIPIETKNLIPACKNLGVTHITNGCYRLHPVEWNIGETAGLLAAHAIREDLDLGEILESDEKLAAFQNLCVGQGIEITWPTLRPL